MSLTGDKAVTIWRRRRATGRFWEEDCQDQTLLFKEFFWLLCGEWMQRARRGDRLGYYGTLGERRWWPEPDWWRTRWREVVRPWTDFQVNGNEWTGLGEGVVRRTLGFWPEQLERGSCCFLRWRELRRAWCFGVSESEMLIQNLHYKYQYSEKEFYKLPWQKLNN